MRCAKRYSLWLIVGGTVALASCASTASLPDDGFVNVPGGRAAFRTMGRPGRVPVLIIHGGPGGTSCTYPATLTGVAASRAVVMYDQLGSGNSDRMVDLERDAMVSRFVSEVAAVRAELGLDTVHLIGHSWGAAVALEYLLSGDAHGVLSVVFVGPLISTDQWVRDANALVELLPEETQEVIRTAKATGRYATPEFEGANAVFESRFFSRGPLDRLTLPECAATPRRFNNELYEYMWGPSEFVVTGTLRGYDRMDRLGDVKIPTLFIIGEYDEVRPDTILEFQRLVPGSRVTVIPKAAHLVHVDQPKAYNDALVEFFSSVEKR